MIKQKDQLTDKQWHGMIWKSRWCKIRKLNHSNNLLKRSFKTRQTIIRQ